MLFLYFCKYYNIEDQIYFLWAVDGEFIFIILVIKFNKMMTLVLFHRISNILHFSIIIFLVR